MISLVEIIFYKRFCTQKWLKFEYLISTLILKVFKDIFQTPPHHPTKRPYIMQLSTCGVYSISNQGLATLVQEEFSVYFYILFLNTLKKVKFSVSRANQVVRVVQNSKSIRSVRGDINFGARFLNHLSVFQFI